MRKLLSLLIALAALVGVSASSFAGCISLMGAGKACGGGGGGSTTQWDPTDHAVDITVTSNTVLTRAAGFSYESARSLTSKSGSSGKVYYELRYSSYGSFDYMGAANASFSLTDHLDNSANAVGIAADCGVFINGTRVGPPVTCSINANDWVGIAIDWTAKRLWLHTPSTTTNFWNNDASADPASGTNGFDISTIAAGPYFITVTTIGGETVTANFGGTTYQYAANVPSGFSNW